MNSSYEVVGLQKADHMPIEFEGQRYDLANLTPQQAAYLLAQGERVPYLKATTTTGVETTIVETPLVETTGGETSGVETSGVETSGVETSGVETSGVETSQREDAQAASAELTPSTP